MQAEVGLAQAAPLTAEAPRAERPLWQVALAAWLGQRLLIGALTLLWQLLLLSFSPADPFAHPTTASGRSAASAADATRRECGETFTRITEFRVNATAPAQRPSAAGEWAGRARAPGPPKQGRDRTSRAPRCSRR